MPYQRDKVKQSAYNKAYRAAVIAERGERYVKMRTASTKWQREIVEEGGERLDMLREYRAKWARDWRDKNPQQKLFQQTKGSAKRRGLEFTLVMEDIE